MNRKFLAATGLGLFLAAAGPGQAAQIVLAPGSVYFSTGDYSATYAANNILDQQSGIIFEQQQDGSYWLAPDNGPTVAQIRIDLGAAYVLDHFELFNTHNAFVNDRGTGDFAILGSNDAAMAGAVTLVSGTLVAQSSANDPLDAQSFAVTNAGAFRYLAFEARSVASANPICCGIRNNYGLNELRAFGSLAGAVPEPSAWALMILGFGMIGAGMRKRKAAWVRTSAGFGLA